MKQIIALSFCVAILTGCANSLPREEHNGPERAYLSYASDPIERFAAMGGIRGWESVSDNYLVLRTDRHKAWLVKTWHCPDLAHARSIRVVSAMSKTVRRTDKIIVGGNSCQIREIRQLDVLKMKSDQAARKAAK